MAIYGAGSIWNNSYEQKEKFFLNNCFALPWEYAQAKDLLATAARLQAGDLIYLKSHNAGGRALTIKAVGMVTHSFFHGFIQDHQPDHPQAEEKFSVPVKWIVLETFTIYLPKIESQLHKLRGDFFYQEHLPFVHEQIIEKLFPD